MGEVKLLLGDCLQKLKELEDNSIDSVVTDPPYGIGFMGKAWDTFDTKNVKKANKEATKSYQNTKDTKQDNPNLKGRKNAPIGGKATFAGTYDLSPSGTLAYQKFCEEWGRECYRVLKPGGHLLSSCSPRMYHRMTVGLEDAGFEIRDQIMWVYGSGFPKSHNIGKSVDKMGGKTIGWFGQWLRDWRQENNITQKEVSKLFPSKTGGLTGCVANWELGLNLPTTEQFNTIIEHFDLPFDNIEELEREVIGTKSAACFGTEERHTIGSSKSVELDITKGNSDWEGWGTALKPAHEPIVMARKPFKGTVAENVLEWGTGGINVDGCRIGYRDEADEKSSIPGSLNSNQKNSLFGMGEGHKHNTEGRFPANIIFDEEAGKILDKQSGNRKGFASQNCNNQKLYGGNALNKSVTTRDGFKEGYNDEGGASRFFYCPKASKKDRSEGNNHPTVKPTDLCAYLIRLVTPKGGVVLDPFMGSGSMGKAAIREGMNFIGIEREEEYMEIAKSRIEYEESKNKHQQFWTL
jgi:DNA modification methylase